MYARSLVDGVNVIKVKTLKELHSYLFDSQQGTSTEIEVVTVNFDPFIFLNMKIEY